jgi:hypothetical protein
METLSLSGAESSVERSTAREIVRTLERIEAKLSALSLRTGPQDAQEESK